MSGRLGDILGDRIPEELRDVPLAIGLRQQGHMETVARMLIDGKTWEEIGAEIHWHPETARHWWCVEAAVMFVKCAADLAACCSCRGARDEHCPEMHSYEEYRSGFRCPKRAHHSFVQHRGSREGRS